MTPVYKTLDRQRRFVVDASHELRAPLTQLHTRAQLLARRAETESPRELAADLQRLVTGTRQLGEIVEDVLLSAQSSRSSTSREPVDLAQLAKDAVAAEDSRAQVKQVTVSLWPGPGQHVVMGTASALRRVIAALLDNAMGHTPPGGRVVVSLDIPHTGIVSLSVSNTGVGLAPALAKHIFERSVRGADGQGRQFGLGLALAREVVESHEGRISAHGRPGYGARFTVELPAARADGVMPGQGKGAAVRGHRRPLRLRIRPAAIHRSRPSTSGARACPSPSVSKRSQGNGCSARERHRRRYPPLRWPRLWCDRRRNSGTEG
jgi:signal transduction histidine kinase